MPLPGGPADKFGNRYELWWTVSQLVRMLHGQTESIRIEDPGVTKAEFVISSGGQREFHQAKRSHPDGKWSLASLAASDVKVLQAMLTELAGNDTKLVCSYRAAMQGICVNWLSGRDTLNLYRNSKRNFWPPGAENTL